MAEQARSRAVRRTKRVRNAASALAALLGAGVVAALLGRGVLAGVLIGCGALSGAVVVLANARLETLAAREAAAADERARIALLATTVPGVRDHVPRLHELSAYDLGADHEAVSPARRDDQVANAYLARDRDRDLEGQLELAFVFGEPRMVVLRGPSKAGKSRSLYEAVHRDGRLHDAAVLKPRDVDALTQLLAPGGCPALPDGPLLVWLDDLELYVQAGHRGINPDALVALGSWPQQVVVLATAGGKGSEQLTNTELAVPIEQLYNSPLVRIVPLSSELSDGERSDARERFEPAVAERVIEHGIGEYLVAAPELARKLEEERAKPGAPPCPEGAALVWAAIDWARAGMTAPLPAATLRELWPLYLHGQPPTDERFERALAWAIEPVYRSIALVQGTDPYRPYDWIVSYAQRQFQRGIDERAWDLMLAAANADAAFELGNVAFAHGEMTRCRRAWTKAKDAGEPRTAALAAFNLGSVLGEAGDVEGARAAWQQAIDTGHEDRAPKAAFNLGVMLGREGDLDGARAALETAIASGHPDAGPRSAFNLGRMLHRGGDVEGARAAYQQAIDSGHAEQAPKAVYNLARLLDDAGDVEGARAALQQAIDSGHEQVAARAQVSLGALCHDEGDLDGARAAWEAAVASSEEEQALMASFNLGVLLKSTGDLEGARAAYQRVIDSGNEDYTPKAAFNLGTMLHREYDVGGAKAAYWKAIDSSDAVQAPKAAFNLGLLLQTCGDHDGARDAFERATQASDPELAENASRALAELAAGQDPAAPPT